MWVHNLNPVLFSLAGLEVRYYGIVYVIGFLIGLWFLMKYRRELSLDKNGVYDLIFWIMIGVLVGSRVFHVVFWEPSYYLQYPWKVFYFWEGGMAFHGGLVGALFAGWLYCKKKGIDLWKVADILSVPAVIGLALGRIANFINAELVGTVTSVRWCVDFGDNVCRHPYVLYDAVGRFIIAGIIWPLRKVKSGFVFLTMVFLLGIERFIVDFFRDEVLYLGLGIGQWMSLVMVVVTTIIFFKFYRGKVFK